MKDNIRPVLLEDLGLRYYLNSNHNFTSILSDTEIEELYKIKEEEDDRSI